MRFEAPETVEAAVTLMAGEPGEARALAGGTDLLVQLKTGRVAPDLIVDLKRIPSMTAITQEDGGFRIGGAVPAAEMLEDEALTAAWPGICEAAYLVGSTQVMGRASLAGNLCTSSPAADTVPIMAAAGATARIMGPDGSRDVAVEDVPSGVQKNALKKGEVIDSIFLPPRPARSSDAYLRFIPRTEMDIAVVGCGVSVTRGEDGTITDAKVALGAVAITVQVVADAAKAIIGTKLDAAALDALAAACSAACKPISDKRGTVEFRTDIAGVLARRAAQIAYDRAGDAA
jgi:carbon-monoxide dehydrogenase medium subunit